MNPIERLAASLRHSRVGRKADWLWNLVRPAYNVFLETVFRRGITRVINGTDPIRLIPACRGVPERYEAEVWPCVMDAVRPGDVIVDVGAYWGLYAIAMAHRTGPGGRVIAFEPNPASAKRLRLNAALNGIIDRTEVVEAAVGREPALVRLVSRESESRVAVDHDSEADFEVTQVSIDQLFATSTLDLMKIDVEGFEEEVLRGGRQLLSDERRRPRCIFIEVHPYAWSSCGSSSASLLAFLSEAGYEVRTLGGDAVSEIREYGEIIAVAKHPRETGVIGR